MFMKYRWMRKSRRKVARFVMSPNNMVFLGAALAVVLALWWSQ